MCLVWRKKINDYSNLQTLPSVWGTEGHRFKSCWPDHNKINDLADKLLILFGYILLSVRTCSDFAPKIIREKRLKNLQKSIKVSSKCLVKFTRADRDRPKGSQEISMGLTGLCLFLLALLCVFAYNVLINKRNWLGDYDAL